MSTLAWIIVALFVGIGIGASAFHFWSVLQLHRIRRGRYPRNRRGRS